MATINFTNSKTPSTTTVGYFGFFEEFFNYIDSWYGRIFLTAAGSGSAYEYLHDAFYGIKTTDGSLVLADYFNSVDKIAKPIIWNFSGQSEYITLGTFALEEAPGDLLDMHTFKNDVVNLGAGSDYLRLYLYLDTNDEKLESSIYKSQKDRVLDGGYIFNVNGGDGADTISAYYSFDESSYSVEKKIDGAWTKTISVPLLVASGGNGNDAIKAENLAAKIDGGAGPDILTSFTFSDRVIGGAGSDTITGSINEYLNTFEIHRLALEQKDLLTGGSSRDTFVIGSQSYALNGARDFAVITDFAREDRISSQFYRGDLLIDPADGKVSLVKTESYDAASFNYTARIFLDTNDDNRLQASTDELLFYICGFQPTAANFVYLA